MILIVGLILASGLMIAALVGARMLEAKTGSVHPKIERIRTVGDRVLAGGLRRIHRVSVHAAYAAGAHGIAAVRAGFSGVMVATSHAVVMVWKVVRHGVDVAQRLVQLITHPKQRTVGKASTTRYTVM